MEVTKELIESLASLHIRRYSIRLEKAKGGRPGYNASECEYYLGLWLGIVAVDYDVSKMTPAQREELAEAVADEE